LKSNNCIIFCAEKNLQAGAKKMQSVLDRPPNIGYKPLRIAGKPSLQLMMCPGSSGVEQRIENPRVGGSNPPPGTTSKKHPVLVAGFFLDCALRSHPPKKCLLHCLNGSTVCG
jgi:hypothetical protein